MNEMEKQRINLVENYKRFFGEDLNQQPEQVGEDVDRDRLSDRWKKENGDFKRVKSEGDYFSDGKQRVPEFAREILSTEELRKIKNKIESLNLGDEVDLENDEVFEKMNEFDDYFEEIVVTKISEVFNIPKEDLEFEVIESPMQTDPDRTDVIIRKK